MNIYTLALAASHSHTHTKTQEVHHDEGALAPELLSSGCDAHCHVCMHIHMHRPPQTNRHTHTAMKEASKATSKKETGVLTAAAHGEYIQVLLLLSLLLLLLK